MIQTNWHSSFSKRHMMSHMVQTGFNFKWYLCRNCVNESILVGHWHWCEFESSNVDRFNTYESAKQRSYIRSPSQSYIVSFWRKYSFWDSQDKFKNKFEYMIQYRFVYWLTNRQCYRWTVLIDYQTVFPV